MSNDKCLMRNAVNDYWQMSREKSCEMTTGKCLMTSDIK